MLPKPAASFTMHFCTMHPAHAFPSLVPSSRVTPPMGAKLIGAFVGFVIVVFFLQSYVFGGDGGGPSTPGRGGAVPTATLPAQLPQPIVLAETSGGAGGGASTNAGGASTRAYVVKSGDTLGAIAPASAYPRTSRLPGSIRSSTSTTSPTPATSRSASTAVPAPAPTARPSATVRPSGSVTVRPSTTGTPAATARPNTSPTVRPATTPTATPRPAASGDTYTVVDGDTGFGIAEKCGVDDPAPWLNELEELNDIDAGDLDIGDELILPAGTGDCG